MNNGMNLISNSDLPWYKQPQMIGRLIILGLIGTFAYFFGVKLFLGTLGLFGSLAVAALFFFFYKNILTAFEVASYKLTDWFIKIDPITIARVNLSRAWKRLQEIKDAVIVLSGQFKSNMELINEKKQRIAENMESADAIINDASIAQEDKGDAQVLIAEAKSLQGWINDLQPLNETIQMLHDGLNICFKVGKTDLEIKSNDLDILEQKFESVNVTWRAITSAKGLFGGELGKRNDYELSIKEANKQINEKQASFDSFMEMARPLIRRAAIKEKLDDSNVQDIIQKMKSGQFKQMITDFENSKLEMSNDGKGGSSKTLPSSQPANKYAELLNGKK